MKAYKSDEELVPPPPAICSAHNKVSVLNIIVVNHRYGGEKRGPFWQYGRFDRSRRKAKLYLKPGYSFVRWEVKCEKC